MGVCGPAEPGSRDLARALDLILQPLVVETLVAIGEGKAIEDVLPVDIDTDQLGAALHRPVTIRAVEPSVGRLLGHHTLTPRGILPAALLDDLDGAIARTEKVATFDIRSSSCRAHNSVRYQ